MHGFQLWANLPVVAQDDHAALSGRRRADIPKSTDDDGTRVRVICGDFWGKTGPSTASPPTRAISTSRSRRAGASGCRSRRRATRSRMSSRAPGPFATPRNRAASEPSRRAGRRSDAGEAGNRSLVLFDRGDEMVVPGFSVDQAARSVSLYHLSFLREFFLIHRANYLYRIARPHYL